MKDFRIASNAIQPTRYKRLSNSEVSSESAGRHLGLAASRWDFRGQPLTEHQKTTTTPGMKP
jgi:hypothetical protein